MDGCAKLLTWPFIAPFRLAAGLMRFPFRLIEWIGASLSIRCMICSAKFEKQASMWLVDDQFKKTCAACDQRLESQLSEEGADSSLRRLE